MVVKPGMRLKSQVDSAEFMVVRAPKDDLDLACGGSPLVVASEAGDKIGEPVAPFDEGSLLGKRYADEDLGLELLCVTAGDGSLSLAGGAVARSRAPSRSRRPTDASVHLSLLLQMIEAALGDRVRRRPARRRPHRRPAGRRGRGAARRGCVEHGSAGVIYVGVNDEGLPVALFGAAVAGRAVHPDQLPAQRRAARRADRAQPRLRSWSPTGVAAARLAARRSGAHPRRRGPTITDGDDVEIDPRDDPDEVAVVLLHERHLGRRRRPPLLRHRHLTSYVLGTVEFAGCDEDDAVARAACRRTTSPAWPTC